VKGKKVARNHMGKTGLRMAGGKKRVGGGKKENEVGEKEHKKENRQGKLL